MNLFVWYSMSLWVNTATNWIETHQSGNMQKIAWFIKFGNGQSIPFVRIYFLFTYQCYQALSAYISQVFLFVTKCFFFGGNLHLNIVPHEDNRDFINQLEPYIFEWTGKEYFMLIIGI